MKVLFLGLSVFLLCFSSHGDDFLVKVKPGAQSLVRTLPIRERIRDDLFLVGQKHLSQWTRSGWVEKVEPNHPIYLYERPNDLAWRQWWLSNPDGLDISPFEAWEVTTGSQEIIVAVIDSGVDFNHPDLQNNMWMNPAERDGKPGVDDDNNGFVDDIYGWNFYPDNNDTFDYRNHGTHVAGIIGAQGNNGYGVVGVNWQTRIMGLNVFPRYLEGRLSDAIRGIDYAVAMGAHVINASWGAGPGEFDPNEWQFLKEAIQRAGDQGVLFVSAAGNSGSSNEVKGDLPASFGLDNIVSVGSFDRYGQASDFSNYGAATVDVFAPGEEIYSTVPGKDFAYKSGTSMAAPVVAGLAALLLSHKSDLTPVLVRELLVNSCVATPALQSLSRCGGGVSASRAISALKK